MSCLQIWEFIPSESSRDDSWLLESPHAFKWGSLHQASRQDSPRFNSLGINSPMLINVEIRAVVNRFDWTGLAWHKHSLRWSKYWCPNGVLWLSLSQLCSTIIRKLQCKNYSLICTIIIQQVFQPAKCRHQQKKKKFTRKVYEWVAPSIDKKNCLVLYNLSENTQVFI